MTPLNSIDKYS